MKIKYTIRGIVLMLRMKMFKFFHKQKVLKGEDRKIF